jgi:hypothetical protein
MTAGQWLWSFIFHFHPLECEGPPPEEAKGRVDFSYSGGALTVRTKSLATKQNPLSIEVQNPTSRPIMSLANQLQNERSACD